MASKFDIVGHGIQDPKPSNRERIELAILKRWVSCSVEVIRTTIALTLLSCVTAVDDQLAPGDELRFIRG